MLGYGSPSWKDNGALTRHCSKGQEIWALGWPLPLSPVSVSRGHWGGVICLGLGKVSAVGWECLLSTLMVGFFKNCTFRGFFFSLCQKVASLSVPLLLNAMYSLYIICDSPASCHSKSSTLALVYQAGKPGRRGLALNMEGDGYRKGESWKIFDYMYSWIYFYPNFPVCINNILLNFK